MIHSQAVAQTPLMYEQEWAGLLARIAAGDQPALAEFYDASSAKVFGLVMKILADRTVAEEVTMDVYTQVWRRASSYDAERGTPGSWLMTLAKTRAIDRFRSSYLERGRQVPLDHAAEVPGDGATPEQYSAGLERQRLVQEAMASLSAEQRQAIALAYYWGLSQSEIADRLQLPLGTVKTRMRLGMIRLREVLAPHGEGVRS
ncbi:MAG: sigma-70 family RNA polymerase sigma factor [Nitrospira sp.]|uniref:sigma-70 family RNA polymerase sigma factor n=1 Tax=Nitrospira sp. ND1 TaxID=1658518 RepID=UPI0009D08621|nr:sigma-70 family RNA polymerase sigma factor [Nitrospira sp. ND1]MBK7417746.1 sigma-70 family RNA polymerase sigma factor [Nitrospira sp.]MBK7485257.1 sigma-70 family RNA polymerase sigma factor [Nitrospira sp.]MBK8377250.1 sigma-70 family RNA polymerase sigma factor [Nitrospira sp.]MBK9996091.1 sigma-70 family RNA polymerase sigma factor [Nitrospira sp.]MBP6199650.1 sigma-70 family RNA polymerase sigma factor [Nitrospira sp.]